jgi:glycosyltransferase involved in cell wall biosynthesis
MFVDRRRQWKTLWLANWMAQHSAYTFQWLWGDKDLMFLAARRLGIPYYTMPYFWDHQDPAIIHFDWNDKLCFIHRCHGKADLYRTGFTTTDQRQHRNDRLPHEDLYWTLFAQLQKDMAEDVRAYRRKHPRITAVTVCIGYSKYLNRTLHANRKHFDDFIVVTEAGDEETRALCEKHNLRVVLSERKNDNGASFNLGALRNDGMSLAEGDWTCFLDADVILPPDLRTKLPVLDESKIYGIHRQGHSEEWNDTPLSGFFQLFHSSQPRKYREDFPDAGFSDTAFRDLWPEADRVMIEGLNARHLGTTALDWKGVKLKKFDGAAVWAELELLPFLPDLSVVPKLVNEIVAKLPRFSCRCRRDAKNYLASNPIDISSPLALAKYIWRWHNHVNRKLHKPEMPWAPAAARTRWDKLLPV